MPTLTAIDRKFLKSLRIKADDDIKDSTLAIFGRCPHCHLPVRPTEDRTMVCIGGCRVKP